MYFNEISGGEQHSCFSHNPSSQRRKWLSRCEDGIRCVRARAQEISPRTRWIQNLCGNIHIVGGGGGGLKSFILHRCEKRFKSSPVFYIVRNNITLDFRFINPMHGYLWVNVENEAHLVFHLPAGGGRRDLFSLLSKVDRGGKREEKKKKPIIFSLLPLVRRVAVAAAASQDGVPFTEEAERAVWLTW